MTQKINTISTPSSRQRLLSDQDKQSLIDSYSQSNIKMTNLSATKFDSLLSARSTKLLPFIPPSSNIFKKDQFVPTNLINTINNSIINETKQSHSYSCDSKKDKYSQKDLLKFQLSHNKDLLHQIISLNRNRQSESTDKQLKEFRKRIKLISKQPKPKLLAPQIEEVKVQHQSVIEENNQKVYWYEIEQDHYRPDMREHAAMEFTNGKLFLYGGLGMKYFNDIHFMEPNKFKWQLIKCEGDGRHQMSSNVFKKSIIYFGGIIGTEADQENKWKPCLSEIKIFNTETFESKVFQTSVVTPRRGHAATIVGRNLIIHGGINYRGQLLNDLYHFDIIQMKWQQGEIEDGCNPYKQGVAFHRCCAIYSKKNVSLYKETERDWVKDEGIYFFGGINNTNQVYILKTQQRPMHWIKANTVGKNIEMRYDHTMNFNDILGLLVIYGGRNDIKFMDDLHILKVRNLTWMQVIILGIPRPPRCGHSAAFLDKKLIIWGGYNQDGFLPSQVQLLELDQSLVSKIAVKEYQLLGQRKEKEKVKEKVIQNNSMERKQFFEKVEQEQKIQDDLKKQVDELMFKNLNSFLPMPKVNISEKKVKYIFEQAIKKKMSRGNLDPSSPKK